MRRLRIAFALACSLPAVHAQQPSTPALLPLDADAIMTRVAANQDQSESERSHYLYVQHARVISRKGNTVRCEEITDTRVAPSGKGYQQQLLKLDGRLLVKGKYVVYNQLPASNHPAKTNAEVADDDEMSITIGGNEAMDRDLVENMRQHFTQDRQDRSRDGIGSGLFPLTSRTQAKYQFHLVGREHMNGRDVFHITFQPRDKTDFDWKGDAYIDASAFQPVLVRTAMSRKVPFAVRTLLGTSLPGLGFNVIYAPQPEGVWFPVSFGTEFKMHVLFFFSREITISAENRDFEQTHVKSTILPVVAEAPSHDPQP